MNFASDNVRGCAPEILQAVVEGMGGAATPYGGDALSQGLEARFSEVFETEVAVAPVTTGSMANGLALALATPPYGAVLCHEQAHIMRAEAGGPEFHTGGAKLVGVAGELAQITPRAVDEALAMLAADGDGAPLPTTLSLTQLTEMGTAYSAAQIAELAECARRSGLRVHMDGARLANALVGLDASPGDLTWRAGVDFLSFGATKNGCIAAEAVVVFNPTDDQRRALAKRRVRAGQQLSKHRFLALQLDRYLRDGLWLRLARHANDQARRLAAGLAPIPGIQFVAPTVGNQLFFAVPQAVEDAWRGAGVGFVDWDGVVKRMVCAFDSDPADVDRIVAIAARAAADPAEAMAARTGR